MKFSSQWVYACKNYAKRWVILTDSHVKVLYAYKLRLFLLSQGVSFVEVLSFPAGEFYKTRQTKEFLEDAMLDLQLGRDCGVIALGGGVVTDLSGFLASTYCRGVPFLAIPTTLLAMVDACVGGKTAVNTKHGKNLIGTFYPPKETFFDFRFLKTLEKKELLNGFAEMIKHGLVYDREHFEKLEGGCFLDAEVIRQSRKIKEEVVEKDPREKGLRRILNFGHTVAHAIEICTQHQMSHGEAVVIGCMVEGLLSCRLSSLPFSEYLRLIHLFERYGMIRQDWKELCSTKMLEAMRLDKKSKETCARFVLLERIGKARSFEGEFCTTLEEAEILRALEEAKEGVHAS